MAGQVSVSNLSLIEVIFSEKGNILAQKSEKFRNKDADFAHPIRIALTKENVAQIGKYVSLAKQINYVTSYGETGEERIRDYEAIRLLCKIILSANRNLPGFSSLYEKAEIINANIPTIYNELIPNAQKAICENLMKDEVLKKQIIEKTKIAKILNMLKEKGVDDAKIEALKTNKQYISGLMLKYRSQITVDDSDWYSDEETRAEIIEEAKKRRMKILFFFRYSSGEFVFGAKNRAYVDPRTLKKLNEKLQEPTKTGEDFLQVFQNSTSKIGAGLGLDLTKVCIENIEEECGASSHALYENDSHGNLIMTITLTLA